MYLYSNEIVFRGHPDKICDQISDALLTEYLRQDKNSRCGIEVVGGKDTIFITGEVSSSAIVNVEEIVKKTLLNIGVNKSYQIINNIGIQSSDIAVGVNAGGAGDQGMMFGYACRDTKQKLPLAMVILQEFSKKYYKFSIIDPESFKPDGKAQITGLYHSNGKLSKIKTFTISYQNDEKNRDRNDKALILLAESICKKYRIEVEQFLINPTGKFEIGGFEGDAGLTGRKIVVDNYHSFANVGGGAFSGKDPTKVDRSAAYKARQIAVRTLNKNFLNWCEVQLSYAIGKKQPLAIYINSDRGYIEPAPELYEECEPQNIIKEFDLLNFDYEKTAQYGHFGLDFPWDK